MYRDLIIYSNQKLKNDLALCWPLFAKLVRKLPPKSQEKWIFSLALELKKDKNPQILRDFLSLCKARQSNSNLARLIEKDRKDRALEQDLLKHELMERLKFLQNQNLTEKEKDLLEEIHGRFPEDEKIKTLVEAFDIRWAQEIISRRPSKFIKGALNQDQVIEDDGEKSLLRSIRKSLQKLTRRHPAHRMDFIIALSMMEDYEGAIELVRSGPKEAEYHWLEVELLIKQKLYIDALDRIDKYANRYADDPEVAFLSIYLRSQAFAGLKFYRDAIELLEILLNARPGYRSAQSLISKWEKES